MTSNQECGVLNDATVTAVCPVFALALSSFVKPVLRALLTILSLLCRFTLHRRACDPGHRCHALTASTELNSVCKNRRHFYTERSRSKRGIGQIFFDVFVWIAFTRPTPSPVERAPPPGSDGPPGVTPESRHDRHLSETQPSAWFLLSQGNKVGEAQLLYHVSGGNLFWIDR